MESCSRAIMALGETGRVVAARISPGQDLVPTIKEICKKNSIESGVIVTCIGSLKSANLVSIDSVPRGESKIGIGHGSPVKTPGPLLLLSSQGNICQTDENQIFIHLHGVISDKEAHLFGGHFAQSDNPVLLTMDLIIIETRNIKMLRRYDDAVGRVEFYPQEK